jgi:hypothetical protein
MVNKKAIARIALSATIVFTVILILTPCYVQAQNIQYHLNHEYAKIWINQDGTIDLLYDIEITCDQGTINYVNVGQPNGDFTIGEAKDENNYTLQTADVSEGSNYRARVYLHTPITTGQNIRFTVLTNVGHMIWEDDPENVGMQFIPCWWDANVNEIRVLVVLPQGVTKENVKCVPDWDNTLSEDNRLVLYWEGHNLQPNQKFPVGEEYVGVSFPKEYVEHYEVPERGIVAFLKSYGVWTAFFAFFVAIVGDAVYVARKGNYVIPIMKMETLGMRKATIPRSGTS